MKQRPADQFVPVQQLLTVADVADRLQVSTRTVRRMIDDGGLAAVKIGRLVRIRPEALAALIEVGDEK